MKKLYSYLQSAVESKDKKKLLAVMDALSIKNVFKENNSKKKKEKYRSFFIDAAPGLGSRSEQDEDPLQSRGLLSSDSLDAFEENMEGEIETEDQSRASVEMTEMLATFVDRFAENVPDPIVSHGIKGICFHATFYSPNLCKCNARLNNIFVFLV